MSAYGNGMRAAWIATWESIAMNVYGAAPHDAERIAEEVMVEMRWVQPSGHTAEEAIRKISAKCAEVV